MDFWFLACIGFVFLAALEYGALLAIKRFCAPSKIKICKRNRSRVTAVSSKEEKAGKEDSFEELALKADKICLAVSVAMFVVFAFMYCMIYIK
jgi:hypothetical protein